MLNIQMILDAICNMQFYFTSDSAAVCQTFWTLFLYRMKYTTIKITLYIARNVHV